MYKDKSNSSEHSKSHILKCCNYSATSEPSVKTLIHLKMSKIMHVSETQVSISPGNPSELHNSELRNPRSLKFFADSEKYTITQPPALECNEPLWQRRTRPQAINFKKSCLSYFLALQC